MKAFAGTLSSMTLHPLIIVCLGSWLNMLLFDSFIFAFGAVQLSLFFCAGGDVPTRIRPAAHHSGLQTLQSQHGGVRHLLPRRPQGWLALRVPRHGGRPPLQRAGGRSCWSLPGAPLQLISAAGEELMLYKRPSGRTEWHVYANSRGHAGIYASRGHTWKKSQILHLRERRSPCLTFITKSFRLRHIRALVAFLSFLP